MIFVSSIWPPPCDSQYRFNLVPWRRLLRNGADNKKVEVAVAHSRKMEQRNNYQEKLEDPPFPEVDQGLFSGMWRAVYFMGLIWFKSGRKLPITYVWLSCYFDSLTKIIDTSLSKLPTTIYCLGLCYFSWFRQNRIFNKKSRFSHGIVFWNHIFVKKWKCVNALYIFVQRK